MEFPWHFSKRGLLLFDSFGFADFKEFIVDKDINIKDKLLFNLKKFNKKDTQINQVLLTFSIEIYKKRKEKKTRKINKHCKRFFSSPIWIWKTEKTKQWDENYYLRRSI